MIDAKLVNLLQAMIQNERSKRERVIGLMLRRGLEKIPVGHGARAVMADRLVARELEHRAKQWLALCRRVFRDTQTPWTDQHSERMTTILGEELSQDIDALTTKYKKTPGVPEGIQPAGSFDASYAYAGSAIRSELQLLSLAQEAAHVPLENQLDAPRYAAVRSAWTRANDLFAKHPADYKPVVLDATGAVEELARLLVGNATATLGTAIRELRKDGRIPPPLLSGIEELWGWASGEPGVRHGATVDSPVGADEARYVLRLANGALGLLISRDVM